MFFLASKDVLSEEFFSYLFKVVKRTGWQAESRTILRQRVELILGSLEGGDLRQELIVKLFQLFLHMGSSFTVEGRLLPVMI